MELAILTDSLKIDLADSQQDTPPRDTFEPGGTR
jgi:hypothetical protein